MIRSPELSEAMGELNETTAQTEAMLEMFTAHLADALENGGGLLSDEQLLNYVWALKAQNSRTKRAIQSINHATAQSANA
ncbi:hypothetical protein [Marinobacter nauticus]|uniref:Uncharacterized protein n=1 Tax=Marinobacter nauticus (strain ATCC 700491 / DSM 11845 / VT8) TaxID=351348 RepID=A1TYD5_MARN8|nr:hypothetical protein [Marinobacter nauticus]ABM17754.1 hypothetical protein Maqu_0656 [Marinobacter nauticus VT8]